MFLRLDQTFIIFLWKFSIDGQINRNTIATGQLDGKFNRITAAFFSYDVALVLLGYKDLFKQISKLDFPPRTARLDVGQYLFEIPDAGCESLHLPKPLMNLFQTIADLFK